MLYLSASPLLKEWCVTNGLVHKNIKKHDKQVKSFHANSRQEDA